MPVPRAVACPHLWHSAAATAAAEALQPRGSRHGGRVSQGGLPAQKASHARCAVQTQRCALSLAVS